MSLGELSVLRKESEDIDSDMASSNVNLCSLYSAIGKHEIALRFALQANELLDSIFKKKLESYGNEMINLDKALGGGIV